MNALFIFAVTTQAEKLCALLEYSRVQSSAHAIIERLQIHANEQFLFGIGVEEGSTLCGLNSLLVGEAALDRCFTRTYTDDGLGDYRELFRFEP